MDCLFCNIVNGVIPSQKIYENECVLAFRDINPQAPFHAVIVPKVHIASAEDITSENSAVVAKIYEAAAVIAKEQKLKRGFRIVTNCGKEGGQTVNHLHFHMLAGRMLAWPPG